MMMMKVLVMQLQTKKKGLITESPQTFDNVALDQENTTDNASFKKRTIQNAFLDMNESGEEMEQENISSE